MQAYFFDTNGWYVGAHDVMADPMHPGQYLVPPNGTLVAPPSLGQNQNAQWVNNAWVVGTNPAYLAEQAAATAAAQTATNNQIVVYYRNKTGLDAAIESWAAYATAMVNGVLCYLGVPMTDPSNADLETLILPAGTDTSSWLTPKGLPAMKIVNEQVVPRMQADIDLDDPDYIAQQAAEANAQCVIFYRNVAGKDNNVLEVTTWGQCTTAWNASAPIYQGRPMTDPANAQVGYLVLPTAPANAGAQNPNGIPTMMVSGNAVVPRDPANVAAEDTTALNARTIVFWRNEPPTKDTKVISWSTWGESNDGNGNALYNGQPVPSTIGYTLFDTMPAGLTSNRNANNVATLAVIDGQVVPRQTSAIAVDCDNATSITNNCQNEINALFAPKENVQLLMETLADVWEAFLGLAAVANIQVSQVNSAAQTSWNNNNAKMSGLFTQIQVLRAQRDAALAALEPAD